MMFVWRTDVRAVANMRLQPVRLLLVLDTGMGQQPGGAWRGPAPWPGRFECIYACAGQPNVQGQDMGNDGSDGRQALGSPPLHALQVRDTVLGSHGPA